MAYSLLHQYGSAFSIFHMTTKKHQFPDAKLSINILNRLTASVPGAFAYSILAGVFGALILIIFLDGVLAFESLMKLIPWILGFNTALTGYSLVEKTRERLTYKRLYAIGSGGIVVILVCLLLTLAFDFGALVTIPQLAIYGLIGIVFSGFGAWVSIKQHQLK